MPFHDEYLRATPLELAFPDAGATAERMAVIAEEAESRGADTGDLGAFAMLASVNGFLRELGGDAASADAILQFAALVFHGYHHVRSGGSTYLVTTPVCRYLVEGKPGEGAPPLPAEAGYAQLPRNLFWIQSDPAHAAEAVDGLFWSASEGRLHVLLVVGMHDGRPGLAVVPLPEAPLADMGGWADETIRTEGRDFSTTLPGGELEGLYSFTAAGEVLKLLARLFSHVHLVPGSLVPGTVPDGDVIPAASARPYERITLDA